MEELAQREVEVQRQLAALAHVADVAVVAHLVAVHLQHQRDRLQRQLRQRGAYIESRHHVMLAVSRVRVCVQLCHLQDNNLPLVQSPA